MNECYQRMCAFMPTQGPFSCSLHLPLRRCKEKSFLIKGKGRLDQNLMKYLLTFCNNFHKIRRGDDVLSCEGVRENVLTLVGFDLKVRISNKRESRNEISVEVKSGQCARAFNPNLIYTPSSQTRFRRSHFFRTLASNTIQLFLLTQLFLSHTDVLSTHFNALSSLSDIR